MQPAAIDDTLYDAFGQRAGGAVFHRLQSLLCDPGGVAGRSGELIETLRELYVQSATGASVPLSTLVHQTTVPVQPLAVNHQSQFPSVTISFNLKARRSLGDAVTQVQTTQAQMGVPATVQGASKAPRRPSSRRSHRSHI